MLILTSTLGPTSLHPLQRMQWKWFQVITPLRIHLLIFLGGVLRRERNSPMAWWDSNQQPCYWKSSVLIIQPPAIPCMLVWCLYYTVYKLFLSFIPYTVFNCSWYNHACYPNYEVKEFFLGPFTLISLLALSEQPTINVLRTTDCNLVYDLEKENRREPYV